jgi:phosphopantothenate-cysteine ligase
MNILITSGGTTEQIDAVRAIANFSSGRLGKLIADRFGEEKEVSRIFCVCGKRSHQPETPKAEMVEVGDTRELEEAVLRIIGDFRIDAVVHSMAVSDYRVRSVSSGSGALLDRAGKISSDEKELIVVLEQTPKIIGMFQAIAPKALLVGFKLLDGVSKEELLRVAHALLTKNRCSYVLANDLRDIKGDKHIGHLIGAGGNSVRFETKQEIAEGIVRAVMGELKGGSMA